MRGDSGACSEGIVLPVAEGLLLFSRPFAGTGVFLSREALLNILVILVFSLSGVANEGIAGPAGEEIGEETTVEDFLGVIAGCIGWR
jgi:hypothetical protein